MARCTDRQRHPGWGTTTERLIEPPPDAESLGHVGLMPIEPGDPTPEHRAAEEAEYMRALNRPLLLHLREQARRGEDNGELEKFRRSEQLRCDSEMQQIAEALQAYGRGDPAPQTVTHRIRRPRLRARRVGCARRRGSRRSTGTGSRAGPGDDSGESDPGDHYLPLVAGESPGEVQ